MRLSVVLTWRPLHTPWDLTPVPCSGAGSGKKGRTSSGRVPAGVDKLAGSGPRNLRLSSKLSIDLPIKILIYLSTFHQTLGTSQTDKNRHKLSPENFTVCFTLEESHFSDFLWLRRNKSKRFSLDLQTP